MPDKWLAAQNRWPARRWLALAAGLLLVALLAAVAVSTSWPRQDARSSDDRQPPATTLKPQHEARQWLVFAADQTTGAAQWQSVADEAADQQDSGEQGQPEAARYNQEAAAKHQSPSVLEAAHQQSFKSTAAKTPPVKRSVARRALRAESEYHLARISMRLALSFGEEALVAHCHCLHATIEHIFQFATKCVTMPPTCWKCLERRQHLQRQEPFEN